MALSKALIVSSEYEGMPNVILSNDLQNSNYIL